jgi:hypothetical protein
MYGISSSSKEAIGIAIEKMFDKLAYDLLGNVPKLRNKSPFFGSSPINSLAHIFIQALGGKEPNFVERDVLRSILNSSHGYIEGLKNRTSSNVMESVDALVKEAKIRNSQGVTSELLMNVIGQQMDKARSEIKLIAEAESTKTRNIGHTMEIASNSVNQGIADPTVFFIIVRASACEECYRLHMLPDRVTPKCYKMSELSMGWHKRGEDRPSACGEHPNCHCTLNQLSPGWGFKDGWISFVSQDHDEYEAQRSA